MAGQKLIRRLFVVALFVLTGGLIMEIYSLAVQANLGLAPAQEARLLQTGSPAPATKCMECHHSELLSRVDQLTTDPAPDLRPAWSPDGARLAFYSGRNDNDDIWVITVDGSDEVQLTQDPGSDRRPAWSPDGTKIVFDSNRSGSYDIWIMDADGSNQKQLTTSPGEEMFASFSPDGSQVLFYGYADGRNDIWVIDVNGSNLRALTTGLADVKQKQCSFACHSPAWSPDGTTIAYHTDQDGKRNIWLMDADGSNPRQLTTTERTSPDAEIVRQNFLPAWTPDGRIIFQAERPMAQTLRTDIRIINADGSDEITLFAGAAHGGPFIWSPDGTRVALHSQRGKAGNFDIFVATFGEVVEEEAIAEEVVETEEISVSEDVATAPEEAALEPTETPASTTLMFWLAGLVAVGVGGGVVVGVFMFSRRLK